jgi:hypothetical protein
MATLIIMVLNEREEIRRRWLAGESAAQIMKALGVNVVALLHAVVDLKRAA